MARCIWALCDGSRRIFRPSPRKRTSQAPHRSLSVMSDVLHLQRPIPLQRKRATRQNRRGVPQFPIQVVQAGGVAQARLDPRAARGRVDALLRDQEHPARAPAAYVCEEASLPEHGECFGKGSATHDHGRQMHSAAPSATSRTAPGTARRRRTLNLARTIAALKLAYVVITSVDRDDLRDGGAAHFVQCNWTVRELSPPPASRCWCRISAAARPRARSARAAPPD